LSLHQNDRTNLTQDRKQHWLVKIALTGILSVALLSAGLGLNTPTTHAQARAYSQGDIVNVIRGVFGSETDQAIRVAQCESGLNPGAYNPSGAMGLFQIMPGTWAGTSQRGASPYDPVANTTAAHDIFVRDGHSWREWVCRS
jgi:soluble lytic murein transglycosylase-like protein